MALGISISPSSLTKDMSTFLDPGVLDPRISTPIAPYTPPAEPTPEPAPVKGPIETIDRLIMPPAPTPISPPVAPSPSEVVSVTQVAPGVVPGAPIGGVLTSGYSVVQQPSTAAAAPAPGREGVLSPGAPRTAAQKAASLAKAANGAAGDRAVTAAGIFGGGKMVPVLLVGGVLAFVVIAAMRRR